MSLDAFERSTSFVDTYRRLAAAQKSSVGVSAYSRWLNRPLGRVLAVVAYRSGLSANFVTGLSALVTLCGIVLLALTTPSTVSAGLVTLLLVLGYALDSADGQVARLGGGGSPAGEWLDHVVDCFKLLLVHVAVLLHWYRMDSLPSTGWLLVPLAFGVIGSGWFFAITLTELLMKLNEHEHVVDTSRRRSPLQAIVVLPAEYGMLCLSFLTMATPVAWIAVYTALMVASGVLLSRQLVVWYRRVSTLAPAR